MAAQDSKSAWAIRHVGFEDLGSFAKPLKARGYDIAYCEAGVDDIETRLVTPPDLLVVLGGPIGAYEEARYPFLAHELSAIERQIEAGQPLIGICLGAQLIARVLGAKVFPGPAKEIGWSPLTPTSQGEQSCLAPLAQNAWQVLHWHGDTFDLPSGTAHLAATDIAPNQAFSFGSRVLALQFHVEVKARAIEQWLIGHAVEISQAGIAPNELRAQTGRWGAGLEAAAPQILDNWLETATQTTA